MKLKNKKTGKIIKLDIHCIAGKVYETLAEINEEWEDYEGPKEYWFIDYDGGVIPFNKREETATDRLMKSIGNYFETKEEAEKAVEKLKAWKRLKGHNLRVERGQRIFVNADNKLTSQKTLFVVGTYEEVEDDLDLLFGGEE